MNVTLAERKLFEKLRKEREQDYKVFSKKDYKGIWTGIIDKYPESAHFIYELLQNADDVEATHVSIRLNRNELYFSHNGKIGFSISDVDSEQQGHINAITAVGNSTKTDSENKIGKFGVGFKAVFQYTQTPEIFEDRFRFRIVNYIVPEEIIYDHPKRKSGETMFVFPFFDADAAYNDIKQRLISLDNPILFLRHLKHIEWIDESVSNQIFVYDKTVDQLTQKDEVTCNHITTTNNGLKREMLMFSRPVDLGVYGKHDISLGYYLLDGKIDTTIRPNIFCFFPTSQKFDLCFVCHAPFLLVDSRQQIKENVELNKNLIQSLADLGASSLVILRDLSMKRDSPLLDGNIFDIVPLSLSHYRWQEAKLTDNDKFYEAFKNVISNNRLLYSRSKDYLTVRESVICTPVTIANIFSSDQLGEYYNEDEMHIDFLSQEICARVFKEDQLDKYLNEIGLDRITSKDIAENLDENFFDNQPIEWLFKFYRFLRADAVKLWKPQNPEKFNVKDYPFLTCPLIKTTEGEWVSPYLPNGSMNVFFPIEGQTKADYNIVCQEILEDKTGQIFIQDLGIKKPDELDFIKNKILPKYSDLKRGTMGCKEISDDFETIYSFAENVSPSTRKALMALLMDQYSFIDTRDGSLQRIDTLYDGNNEFLRRLSTESGYKSKFHIHYEEELKNRIQEAKEADKKDRHDEWKEGVDEEWIDPEEEPFDEWYENNYGYSFEEEYEDEEAEGSAVNTAYISTSISFINYDYYKDTILKHGYSDVHDFLEELGLRTSISIENVINYNAYSFPDEIGDKFNQYSTKGHQFYDYIVKGLDAYFNRNDGCPADFGKWLWNELTKNDFDEVQEGIHKWFYRRDWSDSFQASWITLLKHSRWLLGEYKPSDVTRDDLLNAGYNYNEELFELFEISKGGKSMEELGASQEQISNEALGKKIKSLGISEDELEEIARIVRERRQASTPVKEKSVHEKDETKNTSSSNQYKSKDSKVSNDNTQNQWDDGDDIEEDEVMDSPFSAREELSKPAIDSMFQNNIRNSKSSSHSSSKTTSEKVEELNERMKEDERREKEIIDLQEQADQLPKYSVEWFKTLLELEYQGSSKEFVNKDKKALSISFSRVLQEADSDRIYILKNPSRSIPLWLEEVGGISVLFLFNDRDEVKFNFEVGNVREYTLRLKAKTADAPNLARIDWTKCTRATINVKNPIELVGSLKDAFNELQFNEGFNLKSGLASIKDLNLVFGPPGTGKTTWLSKKISSLINESKECKILVLAPTNKACDVLARKILDTNPDDYSWIYRFVASGDEYLEDMDIVADRESDIHMEDKLCLVSTMARLPFDGFRGDYSQRLMDIDWDYVICDEASMIPLVQMMLVVYRFKQSKIFIAGDPLQIGPIVREPRWHDENIYTMIKLNRFDNPKTEPIQFKIDNLPKQYRSLPAIGELFSQYAYDGKLIHHRSLLKYKNPYLGEIDFNQINFISFKVEKYDSIFGAKKLDESNVHIYSALLTVETCLYVAKSYASKEKEAVYNIGIICPYAPQAQLVERLIEQQEGLPVNVNISVGTIHSFQGDECDMIFALMNPPIGMKGAPDKIFLNRQNIINVAISRAKNILCVVMPHCNTDGYENLYELNRLGYIASQIKNSVNLYTCDEIEEIVLGKKFFLENNTFVTSHQLANVYTKPVKRYEVRIDETSIDIQIGVPKVRS